MDEQFLEKRWMELAKRSYEQSCYTFSEFLDESQLSFFLQVMKRNQYIAFTTFGGYDESERQMIRFGSADIFGYEVPFPIAAIHIKPLIAKFSDELSHRDFLGAIMNTGIERDIVGDILVQNNECYFFCTEKMAPYLLGEIKTIKHTHISCQLVTNIPDSWKRVLIEKETIVASERIDAVIAKICNYSRSQCIELFRSKRVFVNGSQCENNAYFLRKDDKISVRGYGRIVYGGIKLQTKKDKLRIIYYVF